MPGVIIATADICQKPTMITSTTVTPVSSLTDISSICDEQEEKEEFELGEEEDSEIVGLFRTTSIGNVIRVTHRIASFTVRPHSV
jgi:hypothetical protein